MRAASQFRLHPPSQPHPNNLCVPAAFLETAALKRLSSTEASLLYSTEPVWACLFGYLVLGERFTISTAFGGALIVAACVARIANAPEASTPVAGVRAPADAALSATVAAVRPAAVTVAGSVRQMRRLRKLEAEVVGMGENVTQREQLAC